MPGKSLIHPRQESQRHDGEYFQHSLLPKRHTSSQLQRTAAEAGFSESTNIRRAVRYAVMWRGVVFRG